MNKIIGNYLLVSVLMLCGSFLKAQSNDSINANSDLTSNSSLLPFGAEWAKKKGVDLPLPYGVSTFFTYMGRGVEITDVTVEFGGNEPQSINEYSSFGVNNETYVSAIKLDAWVLPVVNVYALFGYASTTANMDVDITIDRPIMPLPPVKLNISTATKVKGFYSGIGTTLVGGYKSWFILGDANYGKTWPDLLNNTIDFTLLSLRSGLTGKLASNGTIRGWIGTAYMDSNTTLEIKAESETLGEVLVKVDQHTENPWTYQCGFSVGVGENFEFMTELGSNFDDASMLVLNVAYRFR